MRHPWPHLCGTDERRPRQGGAPQQAAARRSGLRGHERAREGLGHHRQVARRRRALARAERARRRGGQRRRRPRSSSVAMDARVAVASRGERKGEGENDARVWGAATATRVLFWRKLRTTVRSRSTAARASCLLGRQAAHAGGEGDAAAGRFGGSAVGCWASGPRKGGRAGRGPVFCSWAASTVFLFIVFLFLRKQFQ